MYYLYIIFKHSMNKTLSLYMRKNEYAFRVFSKYHFLPASALLIHYNNSISGFKIFLHNQNLYYITVYKDHVSSEAHIVKV